MSVSPVWVFVRANVPEGSSITAEARNAHAIRQGFSAGTVLTTRPSLATKATSIANFMKKVWIALHGAIIIALFSGIDSCFSRPVFRLAESKADNSSSAMT
jgi:hypothetical protein